MIAERLEPAGYNSDCGIVANRSQHILTLGRPCPSAFRARFAVTSSTPPMTGPVRGPSAPSAAHRSKCRSLAVPRPNQKRHQACRPNRPNRRPPRPPPCSPPSLRPHQRHHAVPRRLRPYQRWPPCSPPSLRPHQRRLWPRQPRTCTPAASAASNSSFPIINPPMCSPAPCAGGPPRRLYRLPFRRTRRRFHHLRQRPHRFPARYWCRVVPGTTSKSAYHQRWWRLWRALVCPLCWCFALDICCSSQEATNTDLFRAKQPQATPEMRKFGCCTLAKDIPILPSMQCS